MVRSFFIFCISSLVLLILCLAVFFIFFLPPVLKTQIENHGSTASGGTLKISELKIIWGLPLRLVVSGLTFESKNRTESISIGELILQVSLAYGIGSYKTPRVVFYSLIQNADVHLRLRPQAKEVQTQSPVHAMPSSFQEMTTAFQITDLNIDFEIRNLNLKIERLLENLSSEIYEAKKTSLKVLLPSVNQPFTLSLNTMLKAPAYFSQEIPFQLNGQILWAQKWIQVLQGQVQIAGIQGQTAGRVTTDLSYHDWNLSVETKDLAQIPIQQLKLPVSSWSGALVSKMKIQKAGTTAPWTGQGEVKLSQVALQVLFQNEKIKYQGPISLNVESKIELKNSEFSIPEIHFSGDATQAELNVPQLLNKPANTALKAQLKGAWLHETFYIQESQVQFDRLMAAIKGQLSLMVPSDVSLQIPVVDVSSFEKLILPLAAYPLKGSLSADLRFAGKMDEPKNLRIQINDLKAQNIQGSIAWTKQDQSMEIVGPFVLNLEARGRIEKMMPVGLIAAGRADLSSMKIRYKELYTKSSGQKMMVQFQTAQKGQGIELKQTRVSSSFGDFVASGQLPLNMTDAFDLQLLIQNFQFDPASKSVPLIAQYLTSGSFSGSVRSRGKMSQDDFLQSSIQTTAQIDLKIPSFKWAPAEVSKGKEDIVKKEKYEPKPFLERKALFDGLVLNFSAQIGRFDFKDLPIHGLTLKSNMKNGVLMAQGDIKKIFEGSVQIPLLKVPLYDKEPVIQSAAKVKGIDLTSALTWGMPQFKDLASGLANADVQVKTNLPQHPEFMQRLEAEGQVSLPEGKMPTLRFVSMVKTALSKIPQIGQKVPDDIGPLEAAIETQFSFKKAILNLKNFDAITTQKDQIQVSGTLGFDKQVDLQGNAAIQNAPVSGSFKEANSDAQGRLVVPIMVKGNLMEPQLGFVDKTIQAMIQKTLDLETQKLKNKAQAEAQKFADQKKKEAEAELEKQKKKIEQGVQGELNKLFGK